MKGKRIKGKIALTVPPPCGVAFRQSDGFFSNGGGVRYGNAMTVTLVKRKYVDLDLPSTAVSRATPF